MFPSCFIWSASADGHKIHLLVVCLPELNIIFWKPIATINNVRTGFKAWPSYLTTCETTDKLIISQIISFFIYKLVIIPHSFFQGVNERTYVVLVCYGGHSKFYRPNVLNNKNFFSHNSEARSPKLRCQQGLFVLRLLFLACVWLSSPWVFTRSSVCVCVLIPSSCKENSQIRATLMTLF